MADERPVRPHRLLLLLPAAALALLTGGLGLLVPTIHGLGATEYQFWRAFPALMLAVPLLGVAAIAGRRGPVVAALALVWPASLVVNLALGHDPLAAALNWRLRGTDLCLQPCPCWPGPKCVVGIENHEHVERWALPDGRVLIVAAGMGLPVPPELRARVGRARW